MVFSLLAVVSLVLAVNGVAPGWWLLVNSALLVIALVCERRGYAPKAPVAGRLVCTAERFTDPTSGQLIEVWEDAATGAREYRPVAASEGREHS